MFKTMKAISTVMFAALLIVSFSNAAHADTLQQVVKCSDTHFESGLYGQYYGAMYPLPPGDSFCAGDDLDTGTIRIVADKYLYVKLDVTLTGSGEPFRLYEIYWVPLGGNPISENDPSGDGTRVLIGQIMTDENGDADDPVCELTCPADKGVAPLVDITTLIDTTQSGMFLFYSRGKWADNDGYGNPINYNTDDGTEYGAFAHKNLWGGATDKFDGVQFISGHQLQ